MAADDVRPGDDPGGSDTFFAQVYDELKAIAHVRMRGERTGHTLQSTELVHEAYVRLRPRDGGAWPNRAYFFAAAAEAMRRILIEHARAKGRLKRGGNTEGQPAAKLPLDISEVAALADDQDPEVILAFDQAIDRLSGMDERAARVVRLRFYAGLSVEEVAETLDVTPRTVLRDWAFARTWLHREMSMG